MSSAAATAETRSHPLAFISSTLFRTQNLYLNAAMIFLENPQKIIMQPQKKKLKSMLSPYLLENKIFKYSGGFHQICWQDVSHRRALLQTTQTLLRYGEVKLQKDRRGAIGGEKEQNNQVKAKPLKKLNPKRKSIMICSDTEENEIESVHQRISDNKSKVEVLNPENGNTMELDPDINEDIHRIEVHNIKPKPVTSKNLEGETLSVFLVFPALVNVCSFMQQPKKSRNKLKWFIKFHLENKRKKNLLSTKNICFESVSKMWWVKKFGCSETLAKLIIGSPRSKNSKNVNLQFTYHASIAHEIQKTFPSKSPKWPTQVSSKYNQHTCHTHARYITHTACLLHIKQNNNSFSEKPTLPKNLVSCFSLTVSVTVYDYKINLPKLMTTLVIIPDSIYKKKKKKSNLTKNQFSF
ncbi:hypothetical protein VP01_4643g1 [Puccinia sorghi]|uniref:Uncharacterized protein n=1 Tax=Puccinia sorghi TaxID=27349 RepID=A0A0L6UNB3_9BASI|nr:hypothetical protein VP01_4643g1 [Puccinia sorghi]